MTPPQIAIATLPFASGVLALLTGAWMRFSSRSPFVAAWLRGFGTALLMAGALAFGLWIRSGGA